MSGQANETKELVEQQENKENEKEGQDVGTESKAEEKTEKRFPPTPPVPPGMTKSAWKRQLRREKWDAKKDELAAKRREKKKRQREEKAKLKREREEAGIVEEERPKKERIVQQKFPINVVVDCGFDDMMKEGERTSLASQITRCYSSNRKYKASVNLRITSLNKLLKERFEGPMKNQHKLWKDVSLEEEDYTPDPESYVYLSSDSSNVIDTLDDNKTYIIGGIVDKGRYKDLCKDKAEKQGIPTARLPIDEFIKIAGRRVLTTNHVFEILLKYLEHKDWKDAFEAVIPQRKLNHAEAEGKETLDESDHEKEEDNSIANNEE
jgi:tRNA (guanine9-N1)-methyltransferase